MRFWHSLALVRLCKYFKQSGPPNIRCSPIAIQQLSYLITITSTFLSQAACTWDSSISISPLICVKSSSFIPGICNRPKYAVLPPAVSLLLYLVRLRNLCLYDLYLDFPSSSFALLLMVIMWPKPTHPWLYFPATYSLNRHKAQPYFIIPVTTNSSSACATRSMVAISINS